MLYEVNRLVRFVFLHPLSIFWISDGSTAIQTFVKIWIEYKKTALKNDVFKAVAHLY
jgi:hypothetical protein